MDEIIPKGKLTGIGKIPAGCRCYFQDSITCILNEDWFFDYELFIYYCMYLHY